jgi:hypothetical protein
MNQNSRAEFKKKKSQIFFKNNKIVMPDLNSDFGKTLVLVVLIYK